MDADSASGISDMLGWRANTTAGGWRVRRRRQADDDNDDGRTTPDGEDGGMTAKTDG